MTQSTSTARNGPGNAHPSGRPDLRAHRLQRLAGSRLYVCTDARRDRGDLEEFLHAAYAGGVDIIQLRDRTIDTVEELAALEILGQVAAEHGKLFAVNDRADIANLASADVLHVGQRDLTPAQARQIVGPDVIIGRSTHHRDQVRAAIADPDTDYFCTGPVWATPTKLGRAAAGLGLVQDAAELAPEHAARGQVAPAQGAPDQSGASGPSAEPDVGAKPWFAIGGMDAGRLPQVQAAGASRAVVVRAITDAADPRAAAAELRGLLTG